MPHLAITAQRYGPISLEKEPRLAAGLERCCSYIARIKRIGVNVASESIGPEQKNPLGVPPLNAETYKRPNRSRVAKWVARGPR